MDGLIFLDCVRKMPLMSLPVRTTIVDLNYARIMISPGSQLSKEELLKVDGITDIVAPCTLHCAGIRKAHDVFPQARVWGPPGMMVSKPEIPWTHELSEKAWPYHVDLKMIEVDGLPRNKEFVFIHKKSKSLIVADLFFNMPKPSGLGPWIILHLLGTYNKFAMSRLFTKFIQDKHAFEISAQKILEEDFENIIVGHGKLFKGGPAEALRAFQERGFKV